MIERHTSANRAYRAPRLRHSAQIQLGGDFGYASERYLPFNRIHHSSRTYKKGGMNQ